MLANYSPVVSSYKLVKSAESGPEFDTRRGKKELRRYVESHYQAIKPNAEITVDHLHEQVLALNMILLRFSGCVLGSVSNLPPVGPSNG